MKKGVAGITNQLCSTSRLFFRTCSTANCKDEDIVRLLNKPLKLLYSKIHPDRFAQQPEIAAKNQESLQNLNLFMDMLSNVKEQQIWNKKNIQSTSLETLQLEFYIPTSDHNTTRGNQGPEESSQPKQHMPLEKHCLETNVRHIAVPLVYDPQQREWLHLLGSLVNLFRCCNIETPHQLLRLTRNIAMRDERKDLSLGQLLKRDVAGRAYELRIRNKRQSADTILQDRVAYECRVLRASLSRAHSIAINIKEDVSPWMAVQGLKRLSECIEEVIVSHGVSIRGGSIQLDGGAQVKQDNYGTLHLGMCCRVSYWQEALRSDSFISSCLENVEMKDTLLEMENKLASALGVRLVCGDTLIEKAPREYLKILSSHIQSLRERKPIVLLGNSFDDTIYRRLLKEYVSIMFRVEVACFEEQPEWGILSVPKDASLDDILRYLQERAMTLAKLARDKQRERAQIEAVRKSLRLERLERDDQVVSCFQFRKCCDRLAASCSILKPILQGLSVVVSDHFQVTENGKVYLPHSFELEERCR